MFGTLVCLHVEKDEIFDLAGIVRRKKQLIPYLTSLLKEMSAEGATPTATGGAWRARVTRPFSRRRSRSVAAAC